MEASNLTEQISNLKSFKGLVDCIFPNKSYCPIQEELWKWFVFALSGKGISISDLQTDEFAVFKDQLVKLVEAVHQWANFHKENPQQEGGCSHG